MVTRTAARPGGARPSFGRYGRHMVRRRVNTRWAAAAHVVSVVAVASCSSGGHPLAHPDGGSRVLSDPRAEVCARVDAGEPVPYGVVQDIFDDQCTSCHGAGADLVLNDNESWSNLVNHTAPPDEACGGTLVVPGDPSASYLFQKLSSNSPCSGLQMPRGELGAEPLPACVVKLISTWIEEGAPAPVEGGGGG
jgi:hypothetical protein